MVLEWRGIFGDGTRPTDPGPRILDRTGGVGRFVRGLRGRTRRPPSTKTPAAVLYAAGGSGGPDVPPDCNEVRPLRGAAAACSAASAWQPCLIVGALMAPRHLDPYLIATHEKNPPVPMRPRRRSGRGDAAADQSAPVARGRAPGGCRRRRGAVPRRPPAVEGRATCPAPARSSTRASGWTRRPARWRTWPTARRSWAGWPAPGSTGVRPPTACPPAIAGAPPPWPGPRRWSGPSRA